MSSNFIIVSPSSGSLRLGPNLRWYWLAKALASSSHSVSIISASFFHKFTCPPSVLNNLDGFNESGISFRFIKVLHYAPKSFSQILNWFLFPLKVFLLRKKIFHGSPSVVIFSSPPIFTLFILPLIKKQYPQHTYIFDVRDLWPLVLDDIRGSKIPFLSSLMSLVEKIAVNSSDYIFSVKQGDHAYFKERYDFESSRFLYAPNGRFAALASNLESPFQRKEGVLYLGYVGSFGYYYDILKFVKLADILSAAGLLKYLHFVFVGGGPLYHLLEAELNLLHPNSSTFFGPVSKSQADIFVSALDICYLPLKDLETNKFGISCNKLYDYMAFNKPIVGHYYPGNYDPIKQSGCGVCHGNGDEALFIPFFRKVIENPSSLKEMGNKGGDFLSKYHSPDVTAKSIIKFLDSKSL